MVFSCSCVKLSYGIDASSQYSPSELGSTSACGLFEPLSYGNCRKRARGEGGIVADVRMLGRGFGEPSEELACDFGESTSF